MAFWCRYSVLSCSASQSPPTRSLALFLCACCLLAPVSVLLPSSKEIVLVWPRWEFFGAAPDLTPFSVCLSSHGWRRCGLGGGFSVRAFSSPACGVCAGFLRPTECKCCLRGLRESWCCVFNRLLVLVPLGTTSWDSLLPFNNRLNVRIFFWTKFFFPYRNSLDSSARSVHQTSLWQTWTPLWFLNSSNNNKMSLWAPTFRLEMFKCSTCLLKFLFSRLNLTWCPILVVSTCSLKIFTNSTSPVRMCVCVCLWLAPLSSLLLSSAPYYYPTMQQQPIPGPAVAGGTTSAGTTTPATGLTAPMYMMAAPNPAQFGTGQMVMMPAPAPQQVRTSWFFFILSRE